MKQQGSFHTRIPKKRDFTEYVYDYADGTKAIISRCHLNGLVDKAIYEELRREVNNNEVQIEIHRTYKKNQELLINLKASEQDVENEVIENLEIKMLYEAIEKLLPNQKRLIQKKYFDNKSNVEIAKEEGVSEGAIRDRLKRIHANLYKELKSFR